MGNDNEVTRQLLDNNEEVPATPVAAPAAGKSAFLAVDIVDHDSRPGTYSLEDEYAATKSSRNILFYVVLGLFLLLMGGGAWAFTWYLENKSSRSDFKLSEFQGLDLKKLLESARDVAKKLSLAQADLAGMKKQRDDELKLIRDNSARRRENILKSGESDAVKKRNLADENKKTAAALKAADEKYAQRIDEKEKQIAALKIQVDQNNKRVRGGVERAQSVVNNYQRLHQMRMDRQKRYYENQIARTILRYNPVFRDSTLRGLTRNAPKTRPETPGVAGYTSELGRDAGFAKGDLKRLKGAVDNQFVLLRRLDKVPYRNSVDPALRRLNGYGRSIVGDYEKMRAGMTASIRRKNASLRAYRYALEYYARIQPESGYVLDGRTSSRVRVHLKDVLRVKGGETARVFRGDNEFIARIQMEAGGRYAKTVLTAPGKSIQPFDKILVDFKE